MFLDSLQSKTDEQIREWIKSTVKAREPENVFFDYKAAPDLNNKKEIAKDMTSFANTMGGALLIGIEEERLNPKLSAGTPKEPYGIDQIPGLETRVRQALEDSVMPRLTNLTFREIKVSETPDKYVYVLHHPKSRVRPHMVRYDERRYFKRVDDRTVVMEHWEIEDLFKEKAQSSLTIEHYLEKIDDGSSLIKKELKHLSFRFIAVPLPVNEGRIDLFGPTGRDFWAGKDFHNTSEGGHSDWHPCEDGVVLHQYLGPVSKSPFILKIHPTGAISYCTQDVADFFNAQHSFYVPALLEMAFRKGFREFFTKYLETLAHDGELFLQASMHNLHVPLDAGIDPRTSIGPAIAHTEYLQSSIKRAETITTHAALKNDLESVVDALLNDIGIKIGVWDYSTKLKRTQSGQNWYRNFLN